METKTVMRDWPVVDHSQHNDIMEDVMQLDFLDLTREDTSC